MIDSDLKYLEPEFREQIAFFPEPDGYNVRHRFTEKPDRLINTVTVNGKTYAYGNLVGADGDGAERKKLIKRYAK